MYRDCLGDLEMCRCVWVGGRRIVIANGLSNNNNKSNLNSYPISVRVSFFERMHRADSQMSDSLTVPIMTPTLHAPHTTHPHTAYCARHSCVNGIVPACRGSERRWACDACIVYADVSIEMIYVLIRVVIHRMRQSFGHRWETVVQVVVLFVEGAGNLLNSITATDTSIYGEQILINEPHDVVLSFLRAKNLKQETMVNSTLASFPDRKYTVPHDVLYQCAVRVR